MSFALFLLAFAFYLSGLCGTIPSYRDSGDLIASIYSLGIAHPPGYALYVLIGKLFTLLLPFGNIPYRVNVLSALFAAGTTALLFRLGGNLMLSSPRRKSGPSPSITNWFPAFAGMTAILFATSPAVVALARVAEMYTLSAFLAAAILLCLSSDHPDGNSSAALLLGLGLSVHPTLIFLIPLFVAAYRPSEKWKPAGYFLIGLMIFLYLPIRASQHPAVNWGDPSHWRNFWRVVTRADYGGLKLHPEQSAFSWTGSSVLAQLNYFAAMMKSEWGWAALLLGCLGIVSGLGQDKERSWTLGLLTSWVLSGPAFFLLSNLPLHEPTTPAILQPYLLLCGVLWVPFVVMGMGCMLSLRGGRRPTKQSVMIDCFAALAMTTLVLSTRPWRFPSQRNDFYAYDYARNLLRSLPPGAVLYEPDDPTHFSIRVLQLVEKRRPDVVLLNFFRTRWGYEEIKRRWPDLLPPIPIESGQELQRLLWSYSARKRPFFAELPQKLTPLSYRSQGLVYAALESSDGSSRERAETLLQGYVQRGDFVTTHHPDFFTSHLVAYYAAAQNNLGIEYFNSGDERRAIAHYQEALRIEPDQPAAAKNIALALQKMRKLL